MGPTRLWYTPIQFQPCQLSVLILGAVAANAGITDSFDMYAASSRTSDNAPPPRPNLKVIDVNLTGVIYTTILAQHYFARNASPGGKITITASSSALYPLEMAPLYAASKSAVGPPPTLTQDSNMDTDGDRYLVSSDQWLPN